MDLAQKVVVNVDGAKDGAKKVGDGGKGALQATRPAYYTHVIQFGCCVTHAACVVGRVGG